MGPWSAFFSAELGACATLAGLVAVAISINLTRILAVAHLPARAAESLLALTAALTLCGVALFPQVDGRIVGGLALALGLLTSVFSARMQIRAHLTPDGPSALRLAVSGLGRLASSLPVGVGGALLCVQLSAGWTWIAAGIVVTLAVSILNAWVLLVEILR